MDPNFQLLQHGAATGGKYLEVWSTDVVTYPQSFAAAKAARLYPLINYQGLWYKFPAESESGWGINFAHQGDVIFATWFTYDVNGKAWWLTMTASKTAEGVYSGQLYPHQRSAVQRLRSAGDADGGGDRDAELH